MNFTASLTSIVNGGPATGSAQYKLSISEEIDIEFEVAVEGATAGTYDVLVDGALVGSVVVGEDGSGSLILKSNPDLENDELPLPEGFPTIHDASTVVVTGLVHGPFAAVINVAGNT